MTIGMFYRVYPDEEQVRGSATWHFERRERIRLHELNYVAPAQLSSWPLATTFGFTEATHPGDYPSFAEIRIVSARFKDAIGRAIGAHDRVQFFPATITYGEQSDSTYSIMYFPDRPGVLDAERSEMLGQAWGRVTLDHTKLDGYHVFALTSASQASFVVSERARRIIEDHGVEGIQFNPIPVS